MSLLRCTSRWAVAALLLTATAARSDVIDLTDGTRLVGTLERLGDGKVVITTQFAGKLELDASAIAGVQTTDKVHVGLSTGDRLVGKVDADPAGQPIVETGFGRIPVPLDKVEAIWPEGAPSPEQVAAQKEIDAKVGKWSLTLEGGVSYQQGNRDILQAQGRAELRRKSEQDLLRFYLWGQYGEQNDIRSAAEFIAGAYYEYLLGEQKRWLLYARTEAEYDEFENLDLRYTAMVGAGYYLIKQPKHELRARGGVGFLHESFMDDTERNTAQAELGLDYMVELTEWLRFTHSATYLPTFESVNDYRLVFDTAFQMPLGDSKNWSLKLGALHQYDPIPNPGFESLDETYYANIVLDLK